MEPDLQTDTLATAAAGSAAARDQARVGLYVHVPFCARRCSYCDFSSGSISTAAVDRYLQAIEREAERRAPVAAGTEFSSVFFGGGTPSALAARHFRRLSAALRRRFRIAAGAEITLEANPESVGERLLDAWAEAGVNRLSMGAQSFDDGELARLGRIHSAARPAAALALARTHGFRRLSLDLMFGFPGNRLERWLATLDTALGLEPEHLSAYCFIPEPGTPLGNAVAQGRVALPDAAEQADAYQALIERAAAAGMTGYETSNFCRPGAEVRHHLVYWLRRPYLALGPSAHGLFNGVRYGNRYALDDWAAALEDGRPAEHEVEPESEITVAREVMMLGLRLADGLRPTDYAAPVWGAVERRYRRAFEQALRCGRLEAFGGGIRIPLAFRFVADDVIAWVEAAADRRPAMTQPFDTSADLFIPSFACHSQPSPAA